MGNIAMIPDEFIETEKHGEVEGYLIESRSTSGLSGSPVFVEVPYAEITGKAFRSTGKAFYWLGLINGHYNIPLPVEDTIVEDSLNQDIVNFGVAIVIPAKKVVETIKQPRIVAIKEKERKELLDEVQITEDSLSDDTLSADETDEIPFTEEDF